VSSKTYFYLTLFGGWFGLHKFAIGKVKMGFIYLFTFGLFGIGWIYDIIKAGTTPQNLRSTHHAYSSYNLPDQSDIYFTHIQDIESMWSVMYNLKEMNGEKAYAFELKCKENINELYNMLNAARRTHYDSSMPLYVPAYVRLAMLYEKQERYQDAINICVQAIKAGAIEDGSKGKMYGRLARLIRKSGIKANDEVSALLLKKI